MNALEAETLLTQQGIQVDQLHLINNRLCRQRIPHTNITQCLAQLANLLGAGISLSDSLLILIQQQHKLPLQYLLQKLYQTIQLGLEFSYALQQQHRFFDPLTCYLIQAGEQTGRFEEMLQQSAAYRHRREKFKRQIFSACLYPLIVIIMATLVTLTLLIVVVPQFESLFTLNQVELPYLTRCMLWISHHLQAHTLTLLFVAMLFLMMPWKRWQARYGLHLPILGALLKQMTIIRCLDTLALSLSAGLSILDGLQLSANVAIHRPFQQAFQTIYKQIESGLPLYQAFKTTQLFPPLVIEVMACGEKSGQLEPLMIHLTQQLQQQLDHSMNNFGTLIEPIMMLILGLVIGFILLAIYLPIFQLGTVAV